MRHKRRLIAAMMDGLPVAVTAFGIRFRSDAGHPSGDGTAPAGGTTSTDDANKGDDGNADDAGKSPTIDGDFDADRAKRAIAAARDAEKKAKAENKAKDDRIAAILAAAGLTPDGKQDPAEQLKAAAAERDAAAEKARATSVELAVFKTAGGNGGDPGRLLDSRAFTGSIKDLDPDAADFADKVGKAIKATVEKHPHLAAGDAVGGQGPARQGVDHTGGGTGTKERPKGLAQALNNLRGQ